jgi:phosphatidylserine/phosphatidylglycerophosphate/cardiolipin synthase-like enzyme
VRFVVDDEHVDAAVINRLRRNGMSVVGDSRSAFMHNKFMVVDGHTVWTGSMNYTTNDVYCNNNNLVRLEAPALARNYTIEFEEMFVDRAFGTTSPRNTTAVLDINGVRVENYFSAEDKPSGRVAEIIGAAQSEILFMAFSFTQEAIGEAMLARARAGVPVQGVFERTGSETRFSYFLPMRDEGLANLQVRQDGNPRTLHHKVIIIDRSIVIFGSYNFSANAENSNDENMVILFDPDFASFFVQEFETVWAEARQ